MILINRYLYDWMHPGTEPRQETSWLCIPVFSYKGRHTNRYIINDQRLCNPGQFYLPAAYADNAGFDDVSCAHLNAMQVIPEKYLTMFKHKGIDRGLKLSELATKLVIYHYISNMNVLQSFLPELSSKEATQYELFKEAVNMGIDSMIGAGFQGLK